MTLLLTLDHELEARLQVEAKRRGVRVETVAQQILTDHLSVLQDEPSIWDQILQDVAQAPPGQIACLPEDLSEQHDHYAYGVPKR